MSKDIVVEVEARTASGSNAAGRVRRAGKIPGIVYGLDRPPFPVSVDQRALGEVLKLESGRNTIFNLLLTGQDRSRAVMIRDLQRDPLTDRITHVDLVRVDLQKTITVEVPVRLVGIPVGVKVEGGLLEYVTRTVEVECLPGDIPEHLDVDISDLHLNQNVSVSAIQAGDTFKILTDPESILAVVATTKAEEAATPAEGEAAAAATPAEPEVLKKGKDEAKPE